jgi:hypothetical protein
MGQAGGAAPVSPMASQGGTVAMGKQLRPAQDQRGRQSQSARRIKARQTASTRAAATRHAGASVRTTNKRAAEAKGDGSIGRSSGCSELSGCVEAICPRS